MKHAVIVGGTKGLGREVAERLSSGGGWHLSILGRTLPQQVLTGADYHAADLANPTERERALNAAVTARGLIDTLVLCQRFRGQGDPWKGEIDVTVTATKEILEWSASRFALDGWRSVVLVGSVAGWWIAAEQPVGYHLAKVGLEAMTRYFAVKWGPERIRINAVSPSAFIKAESRDYHNSHPEVSQRMAGLTPLRRMGTAADTAEAILFLASDRAGFITGQNLVVDGGLTLQLQTALG